MKKLIRKLVIWAFKNVTVQTSITHGGHITIIDQKENTTTENSDVIEVKSKFGQVIISDDSIDIGKR